MFLESLLFILFHLLFPPFIFIITLTLVLASFGKSLGIRRLYVKILIYIFEYAKNVSLSHERRKKSVFKVGEPISESSDEDVVDGGAGDTNKYDATSEDYEDQMLEQDDGEFELTGGGGAWPAKLDRKTTRHNVISRKDNLILIPDKPQPINTIQEEEEEDKLDSVASKLLLARNVSANTFQREFNLSDVLDYVKTGVAAIIEDEVTQRFVAEELKSWNLLTRTNQHFEFINWKLTFFWLLGFFFRYCILFPGRLAILVVGMTVLVGSSAFCGMIPFLGVRKWLYNRTTLTVFRILSRSFSSVITFHSQENRPKSDGICVANHTSPIDIIILLCDRTYAMVGQSHGGIIGIVQQSLSRASAHIWFQRAEVKDRAEVARRLKEHVEDPNKLPILIFPEGTCINNTSVMQFKKGSFEVGGVIYPVAIKYDPKFGDAFWNSSEDSMIQYLFKMMTSWAIVVDVWYLPPMTRIEGEDAIAFADRVKHEIALKGGLVDLVWDGNLKRQQVKSEWKAAQQQQFSRRIKVE